MRLSLPSMMLSAALLAGFWSSPALAQVSVEVPARVGVGGPVRIDAQIAPRAVAPAVVQEDWRFKQHNGAWWYYTPENYWMVHRNGAWQRYQAQAAVNATIPAPAVVTPAPVVTTPAPVVTSPAPVVTTPAPIVTTPAPVITTRPAPVVTPPLRVTPLRPGVGAVVRPRFR